MYRIVIVCCERLLRVDARNFTAVGIRLMIRRALVTKSEISHLGILSVGRQSVRDLVSDSDAIHRGNIKGAISVSGCFRLLLLLSNAFCKLLKIQDVPNFESYCAHHF